MPGLPVAADGATFDKAVDEMILALREYADDWQSRLRAAPNHRENWGLVQLIGLSNDAQLRDWLVRGRLMAWPEPTWERHERFCKTEGWQQVHDPRGRTGTHRATYEFDAPDGRVLRTRISHPVDRTGHGAALWSHILRDQLDVTEETFWQCVLDGVLPNRGTMEPPLGSLPADLVHLLIHRVGLGADVVAAMSKDEAIARLQRFWTDGV
ncbi:hypothetical protein [Nocardia amamiensis]|uniref:hypothetical protein n=1 Tax=Nocardia amamiensis TaxID=404578 RepID=UPI003411A99E